MAQANPTDNGTESEHSTEINPVTGREIDRTVEMTGAARVVREDIVVAVKKAFEQSIGHLVENRTIHFTAANEHDHHVAHYSFDYFEIPAVCVDPDAGYEWLPPYRCRELVEAELREELPDDIRFEPKNGHVTTLYCE